MMVRMGVILGCFFLGACLKGNAQKLAQQFIFEKVSRKQVRSCLEDSHGTLWVGAKGLYRYDGQELIPKRLLDENGETLFLGWVNAFLQQGTEGLWIGCSRGLFLYDRTTDRAIQYWDPSLAPHYRDSRKHGVMALVADSTGRVWVGTRRGLFCLSALPDKEIRVIPGIEFPSREQGALGITSLAIGEEGTCYAASTNGLWAVTDTGVTHLIPASWPGDGEDFLVKDMVQGRGDTLWLATMAGLWAFHQQEKSFSQHHRHREMGRYLTAITSDSLGGLWLGTMDRGIIYLSPEKDLQHFSVDLSNPYSLTDNRITFLSVDSFNQLWVASWFGLDKLNLQALDVPFYQIFPGPYRRDNYTHRVLQDADGGFWFRLIRVGLGYAAGLGAEAEQVLKPQFGSDVEEIKHFCLDADSNVWVLTLTQGLYQFPRGKQTYSEHVIDDTLRQAFCLYIHADHHNPQYLWFTSEFGLCRFNRHTLERKWFFPQAQIPALPRNLTSVITQGVDGTLWLVVRSPEGPRLVAFDPVKEAFIFRPEDPQHPSSVDVGGSHHLVHVGGDSIWYGTLKGLMILNSRTHHYTFLPLGSELPFDGIQSICPDQAGHVWFTSRTQLCRFDGKGFQCRPIRQGIEGFTYSSAARRPNGQLVFGGTNGIIVFDPQQVQFERPLPAHSIFLTDFTVLGQSRAWPTVGDQHSSIQLSHRENVFSLRFGGARSHHDVPLRYRYRLTPLQDKWVLANPELPKATYTKLPPGAYTFEVEAIDGQEVPLPAISPIRMNIRVLPPWYQTPLAICLWIGLGVITLWQGYQFQRDRRQSKQEAQRLKERAAVRNRLFTHLTHEFRTPLTIIQGMAQQLQKHPTTDLAENTQMIHRSTQYLLRLVTQLLDLGKLRDKQGELTYILADVVPLISYVATTFQHQANEQSVDLCIESRVPTLIMDHDPDRLRQVISNLLSNALKFTPTGGSITMTWEETDDQLCILVQDTGIGIAPADLPHIFEQLYQGQGAEHHAEVGVGVGLALTHELVTRMGGTIAVESKEGVGSSFQVLLPITREATLSQPRSVASVRPGPTGKAMVDPPSGSLPRLLIIEDHPDIVRYLQTCLQDSYTLLIARGGREGQDLALEEVPDLILCDVMMPGINGFEVCQFLKQDRRTSHIPIVMLTARADDEARLSSWDHGADAHLTKPFSEQELKLRLQKLWEIRQRLRETYQAWTPDRITEGTPADREVTFLTDFYQQLEAHYTDEGLTIPTLSAKMHLTRGQLHKKLDALTQKNASTHLREFRLAKARERLLRTDLPVATIAYEVGFRQASYFSRTFTELYGSSPKAYREEAVSQD